MHLGYKLDGDRKLSASYSIQRPPSILLDPLLIVDGPQDLQVGNPSLKPKETRSFELGYEQHAGQQSYQATIYYRQTKNDFAQVITDQGGAASSSTASGTSAWARPWAPTWRQTAS